MTHRILLLEDEQAIADTLLFALRREGFEVQHWPTDSDKGAQEQGTSEKTSPLNFRPYKSIAYKCEKSEKWGFAEVL